MPAIIPGKLLYLATPHTASIATRVALEKLPGALIERISHHCERSEVAHLCTGKELVVSTVRYPPDLVATWWVRQYEPKRPHFPPCENFDYFVRNIERLILATHPPGKTSPYMRRGKMFWHDADEWLHWETLQEDLDALLTRLNLPTVQLEQHNVTTGRKPWRQYYTPETLGIVCNRFCEEMRQHGYRHGS